MKKIICKNADNVQVEFEYDFSPFFLVSVDGVYSISNKVITSENTMIDGSTYQGSTTKERNIVITAQMENDYQKHRDLLYKCFKPKTLGTLTYIENDSERTIDYRVEEIDINEKGIVRDFVISLICTDPFFKDTFDTEVTMSSWQSAFAFVHAFNEEGEAFAERENEPLKEIKNDSAADNIGLTITIKADGPITNPAIYHVENMEYVAIGTADNPFSLEAGDVLIITTHTNNKAVYLLKNGEKREINEYLDEESEFIQLEHGINTLKYEAAAGEDYMNVTISYRFRYLGV
ncbi:phage tail family protein [Lachnospiraceae bacterium OttesenSCG-928-J05]|nr:phage tail family protein [Lachnospiraceae bacterium OttesenSCG-928-J05]